jgi:hypothetical protein
MGDVPTRRITSCEQLLAIDFSAYDEILLVPTSGQSDPEFNRWQWERDKVMFTQAALMCGVSFDELIQKTRPHFGDLWLPPDVTRALIDMGKITLPTFHMARQTPEQWGATAKSQCADLIDQLVAFQEENIANELKSGALNAVPRRRKTVIDDATANTMAAKRYFHGTRWLDLADQHPPPGGYSKFCATSKKQRENRAAHIQARVNDILIRLKLVAKKRA